MFPALQSSSSFQCHFHLQHLHERVEMCVRSLDLHLTIVFVFSKSSHNKKNKKYFSFSENWTFSSVAHAYFETFVIVYVNFPNHASFWNFGFHIFKERKKFGKIVSRKLKNLKRWFYLEKHLLGDESLKTILQVATLISVTLLRTRKSTKLVSFLWFDLKKKNLNSESSTS